MRLLSCFFAFLLSLSAVASPIMVLPAGTVTISCANTTSATALVVPSDNNTRQIEISNAGSVAVFVQPGISTVTATVAASYPILAGQTKVITVPYTTTHLACISASGTQTVYVSTGFGD